MPNTRHDKSAQTYSETSSLQQALETGLASLPFLFLENLIQKKLQAQLSVPPQGLARQMADHLLSGESEPFRAVGIEDELDVHITLDDSDLKQLENEVTKFQREQLPDLLKSISVDTARSTLRSLKSRWPDEQRMQEDDLASFRERMLHRWDKPLGQLRMLLTMVREWCSMVHLRDQSAPNETGRRTRQLLLRMLVRACQVTDEILCLLENGFADGAMARWRTLHEVAIVAAVVSRFGDDIIDRYTDHQHVESKRALEKYNASSPELGFRPLGARVQKRIIRDYDRVLAKYGKTFKSDYGWAAYHLQKDRPTFADLEAAAGKAEMRSYYQMGNDNVHAGVKSMYVRLGLVGGYDGFLAGRSNAGLTDPGQNTAHTLTQLAVLVCDREPVLDDRVISLALCQLRNEIPKEFAKIDSQIKTAERALRRDKIEDL